jgi:hypothetical protein
MGEDNGVAPSELMGSSAATSSRSEEKVLCDLLAVAAGRIKNIAWSIPPPNEYTPQLVQLAEAMLVEAKFYEHKIRSRLQPAAAVEAPSAERVDTNPSRAERHVVVPVELLERAKYIIANNAADGDELAAKIFTALTALSAAPPVQMEAVALGEFDHHPDPAVDFCIEVEEIVAQHWNLTHGLHAPTAWQLGNRVRRAMDFRVGGDPSAVAAKDQLREIEKALASPVPSSERYPDWSTLHQKIADKQVFLAKGTIEHDGRLPGRRSGICSAQPMRLMASRHPSDPTS